VPGLIPAHYWVTGVPWPVLPCCTTKPPVPGLAFFIRVNVHAQKFFKKNSVEKFRSKKFQRNHFPGKNSPREKNLAGFETAKKNARSSAGNFGVRGFLYEQDSPCIVLSMTAKPDPLRVAAAVILGIITGSILFLVVALFIGFFNDMAHMNISVSTNVAENIFSAILLVVLIIACVAGFYHKVVTTPPSEPVQED
jgi:hypothetical protein